MRRSAVFLIATLAACVSDAGATANRCELARAALDECSLPSHGLDVCDARARGIADEVIDTIDRFGCGGPTEAEKGDWTGCEATGNRLAWCDASPVLLPEPSGRVAAYPIIFVHGFNTGGRSTSVLNYWRFRDVDTTLAADGHTIYMADVPPYDTPAVRGRHLAQQIDMVLERYGAEKVNLVCFSAGGIDCRYVASPNGADYGAWIASVTLISAPNRGMYFADLAARNTPGWLDEHADKFFTWYGKRITDYRQDAEFSAAIESMSEAGMAEFNASYRDASGVFIQSWAGFSSIGGIALSKDALVADCTDDNGELKLFWNEDRWDTMNPLIAWQAPMVGRLEGLLNDGTSLITSSKWGVFQGCVPADHLDFTGNGGSPGKANAWTGFDYLRFYRNLAYDLAARGF